jgi:5'-methylthioadenosine phosphorylase
VDVILANLMKNAENAQKVVREAVKSMPAERTCSCGRALQHAILTNNGAITEPAKNKLGLLIEKYI